MHFHTFPLLVLLSGLETAFVPLQELEARLSHRALPPCLPRRLPPAPPPLSVRYRAQLKFAESFLQPRLQPVPKERLYVVPVIMQARRTEVAVSNLPRSSQGSEYSS